MQEPSEETGLAAHVLAGQAVAWRAAMQASAASVWR